MLGILRLGSFFWMHNKIHSFLGTITKEQATKGSKPATVTSSPSTNITQDQKNGWYLLINLIILIFTFLFSDAVETSKPVSIPTAVTKPVSDSLFSRSPSPPSSTIPKVSLPKKETATSSKKTGGLFGEDSDDDSLFPQAAVVKTKPVQKSGGEESSQVRDLVTFYIPSYLHFMF